MLPLERITVVALEQAVTAPFATHQLADLGARVIKIERSGVGDFARGYDTTVNGMASEWRNQRTTTHMEAIRLLAQEPALATITSTQGDLDQKR